MREFIDETIERQGTDMNRDHMMAIQGFDSQNITYVNGQQIIVNRLGQTLTTTVNAEGNVIVETFEGEKTIVKTTTFDNGNISEVIS